MGRALALAVLLVCGSVLGACASVSDRTAAETGLQVEAQRTVLVTDEPLGDVVSGELGAGDRVMALCFVGAARTNTGARGTAIRVEAARRSGYVATTDFPDDPADRTMVFDVAEAELRDRLPACP